MAMMIAFLRALLVSCGLIRRPDFVIERVGEHPDRASLRNGIVYVVCDGPYAKWAYFLCPSGNGNVFQLSLQQKRRPRWTASSDFLRRATIHPSIRQLDGAYAHFWVRGGLVEWCADTGKPPLYGSAAASEDEE